jgi:signal transduction histidine kinase
MKNNDSKFDQKPVPLIDESVRNKTIFIQNLSHQIRTPLNVITGFANILLDNIAYGSHWGNQWFLR